MSKKKYSWKWFRERSHNDDMAQMFMDAVLRIHKGDEIGKMIQRANKQKRKIRKSPK